MSDTKAPELDLPGGGLSELVLPRRPIERGIARVIITVVAWLPLLVLTLIAGTTTGTTVTIPFLNDPVPHARFLIAFPILIAAGKLVNQRLADVVTYLWGSDIVDDDDRARFKADVTRAVRLSDSMLADVVALIIAYAGAWMVASKGLTDGISTWFASGSNGEYMSPAGWWYTLVSLPVWQFVFLRWTWRIGVWWRFLWKLSRLDLRLLPTHPDRVGGLGVLEVGQLSLSILVFATAAVLSGILADTIHGGDMTLPGAAPTIAVFVLISLFFVVAPLFAFSGPLIKAKRRGLIEHGDLAADLFGSFEKKWIDKKDDVQKKLLGNADPSSLADYGYAYENVTAMRVLPFSRKSMMSVVILALIPFAPLLLIQHSVKDILKMLMGILG